MGRQTRVRVGGNVEQSERLEKVVGGAVSRGEEVIVDVCRSWVTPWKIHDSYVVEVVEKAHSVLLVQEAEAVSGALKGVQTLICVDRVQIYSAMSGMFLHEFPYRAHSVGPEKSLASTESLRVPSHSHHHTVIAFVWRVRF